MSIENQLLANSHLTAIYQNIDEFNCNEQQFEPLINLNNEMKPQSQQLSHFQNTSYDNNRY